ncbi:hypothetical protein GCM10010168_65800 [Actinoplanes ianthinogenes]|uniref:Fibronectin type-III domain-containing protein n=1 Tax=Actinoplanes ianthinogenes TaxID=122358 RepID=A0ABM7LS25_9ACTN|nr:Calx-beta domain-containing protein [Actinoplanes ianthinogenes]BCJ42044.1 hypothetical protein Aiant_27010 [Actinoplanes ianthinogenes]GGR38024.1 hypothetical protein GCM10010168_65800 [Actinoplanes ianthinogenes]
MRFQIPPRLWSPARFRKALVAAVAAGLGSVFVAGVPASADGEPTVMTGWVEGFAEGEAGTHTETLAITTDPPPAEPVNLHVSVEEDANAADNGGRGHATAGVDFEPVETDVLYDPDSETGAAFVEVTIHGDAVFEGMETFTVVVGGEPHQVLLPDDEEPPLLPVGFDEKEGSTVDLSATVNEPVDAPTPFFAQVIPDAFPDEGDTAEVDDFDDAGLVKSGTVNPGDTSIDLGSIDLKIDRTDEFTERVVIVVGLGQPQDGLAFGVAATIQDADDDLPPRIVANPPGDMSMREGAFYDVPFHLEFGYEGNMAARTEKPVSASWTMSSADATLDADYDGPAEGTVDFDPGSGEGSVHFGTVNDGDFESDEHVSLSLHDPVNASEIAGSPITLTITDDESYVPPAFSMTSEVSATEGQAETAKFTVTLDETQSEDAYFNVFVREGSAGAGDFGPVDEKLLIEAGDRTATVEVPILDDSAYESTEQATVEVVLDGDESGPTGTLSIDDDDPVPTLTLNTVTGAEGGTVDVMATPTGVAQDDLTYAVTLTGDGASPAEAEDYSADSGPVELPAGTTEPVRLRQISLLNDTIDEPAESLKATVTNESVEGVDPVSTHYTITDDPADLPPTVSLGSTTAVEGGGFAEVPVDLSFAGANGATSTEQSVSVGYELLPGTATAADFGPSASANPLVLPPGTTHGSIQVPIVDDASREPMESFYARTTGVTPTGATLGSEIGTVTIRESDQDQPRPTFSISGDTRVAEGGTATFKIVLSKAADADVDLTVAMRPGTATAAGNDEGEQDYGLPVATVRIPQGGVSATVEVPIRQDSVYEGDESAQLIVQLATGEDDAAGDPQQVDLTIVDDDPKVQIVLDPAATAVTEGDTVKLSGQVKGVAQRDVTFDRPVIAASAEIADYELSDPDTVVPGGTASGTKINLGTIHFNRDATDEDTEAIKLSFGGNVLTFQVADDPKDVAPKVTIDDTSLGEGDGAAELTVSLVFSGETRATERTITVPWQTVDGTADAGKDYTKSSGQLTLTPPLSVGTIRVPVLADTRDEADQTFTVRLGAPSPADVALAKPAGKVTIEDDDKPKAPTLTAPAGISGVGRVELTGFAGANAKVELLSAVGTSGGSFRTVLTTKADDDGAYQFTPNFALGYRVMTRANGLTSPVRTVQVKQDPTLTVVSAKRNVTFSVKGDPDEPGQRVIIQRQVSGDWREADTGELNGAGKFTTTLKSLKPGTYVFRAVIASSPSIGVVSGASDSVTVKIK